MRAVRVVVAAALGSALACQTTSAPVAAHDPRLAEAEAALLAEQWIVAEAKFADVAAEADPQALGARCHYWIGVCRRQQGDRPGARAAFGRALASREPEWQARTRLAIGDDAWDAGDWAAAREMYATADAAALLTDEARRLRLRLARATVRGGDWETGTDLLTTLLGDATAASDYPGAAPWHVLTRALRERRYVCLVAGGTPEGSPDALIERAQERGLRWSEPLPTGADPGGALLGPFDAFADARAEAERLTTQAWSADVWP